VQGPDGAFLAETYEFKEGGNFGGPRQDVTMDKLTFDDVSKVIAPLLAAQSYLPSDDPSSTKLLIVVYWGATIVPEDVNPHDTRASLHLKELALQALTAAKEGDPTGMQRYRDLTADSEASEKSEAAQDGTIDAKSANILGYTDEIFKTGQFDPKITTLRDEIERDRYYVVLLAYDYHAARRYGQHRLLWETRFSIPEPGNDFEKAFPIMASIASKYFGQDSRGLVHHNLDDGKVEVGEPKSLGAVPEK
jgi:hypothetical protein